MQLRMQSALSANGLHYTSWSVAVVGEAVDDRGTIAAEFARVNSSKLCTVKYLPQNLEVEVDGRLTAADTLSDLFSIPDDCHILLETTTLGFVETFLLCKLAKEAGVKSIDLLYTEPLSYRTRTRSEVLLKRDFDLSNEVEDFSGVPGAGMMTVWDKIRTVFLVGYEGQRLEQALDQINLKPSNCCIVFGVPAYQPGWEMDSFANNIRVIKDRQINEIMYTGAQNPAGAYAILKKIQASCQKGERMLVSPIGTKPHGIGVALFACNNASVGLSYDHPSRRKGRSSEIATWHLYTAIFNP